MCTCACVHAHLCISSAFSVFCDKEIFFVPILAELDLKTNYRFPAFITGLAGNRLWSVAINVLESNSKSFPHENPAAQL